MTNFKDVTNMTQCKWLLSGSDRVKVETACKCQLALRNAKRKNAAIEAINDSNEADRAARQKRGEAIFNEFIEKLTTFQKGYIREMNRLRKVEAGGAICHAKLGVGGCGGFTGDNCATDCFSKDAGRNPKRCWSGRNEKCDLGIFGGETARCLVTYPEIMKVMTASRSNDLWKTAHTLVPEDGSLGKIEKMTHPFFAQDVKDPGTPSAGSSCNDDYRKPGGKILPLYIPPDPREKIAKDPESIACCTNIINDLGISGADVINQSITGCGAFSDVKEKAKQVEVEQSVSSIDDPSGNPLVNFAYKQPILASVSAGSVSLIVFTIILSILFRRVWIGLGVGSLFGITTGVAGFIILKRVIDDKNAKLLADLEKVKQARAQSKAEYEQKIAEIEAEPPSKGSCDEECGENSVKEELGGNLTVGAGVNKRCICECKKDFSPGGLERPACQPENFVCTEAAKEALKLPNAGVVTCGFGTSLKSSPPNIFFDNERAARNVCCERLEVEPSVTF